MRSIQRHTDEDVHGNKPWVYFMIDCFFLMTAFTIVSFQMKTDETVLENKLPREGGIARESLSAPEPVHIHVIATNGVPQFRVEGNESSETEMMASLASLAQLGPERYRVKISYDADTPWSDVILVINACTTVGILDCGLVPLRGIN